MKRSNQSTRFWIEASLSAANGLLLLLTLFWKDWIEALTGLDPDHHNGSLEWGIAATLLVLTLFFAQLARLEWRQGTSLAPAQD